MSAIRGRPRDDSAAYFAQRQQDCARAYDATLRDLQQWRLPPGKPISVRALATELAVSMRRARAVCRQLARERWAIETGNAAFLAWHCDDASLAALYDTNEALLTSALRHARLGHATPADVRRLLGRSRDVLSTQRLTSRSLAAHTGALLHAIAAAAGNEDGEDLIRLSNRRLYYLRIQECRYLQDVARELTRLCEAALIGDDVALKQAIAVYHARRRDLLPVLPGLIAVERELA